MHYVWEAILAMAMISASGFMLQRAFPKEHNGVTEYKESMYYFALLAWLPMFFVGYLLWHPLTGHYSNPFQWWMCSWVVLLAVGVGLTIKSMFSPQEPMLEPVILVGVSLAIIPLPSIGWSGSVPATTWHWGLACTVCGVVLGILARVFVLRKSGKGPLAGLSGRRLIMGVIPVVAAALVFGAIAISGKGHSLPQGDGSPTNGTSSSSSASTTGSSSTATSPTASLSNVSAPDNELLDELKAAQAHAPACKTYVSANQLNSDGTIKPVDATLSFLGSVPKHVRYSGDSIDTAVTDKTSGDQFKTLADKICTRPYVGYSFGNLLYGTQIGKGGKTIGSLLSDMGPASATHIGSMVKAALASPTAWASYEAYAAKVVNVLNLFNIVGDSSSPMSTWNLHFANGGVPDKTGYPMVEVNPKQENLPALVLALKNKGQSCELARIGVNLKDSRPERFAPQGCTVAPPVCTSGPHKGQPVPSGGCNPPRQTSTPPGKTSTHPTPPHHSHTPPPPPTSTNTKPPKTCESVYGPGYHGNYPNCFKNGASSVQPTQPGSATGTNPPPNPTSNPGSNQCYWNATGKPVPAKDIINGVCPPGSSGS